jgi:hypothetical protein
MLAENHAGFGKATEQPGIDHRLSARPLSSAGWNTGMRLPIQLFRVSVRSAAAPTNHVT